MLMGILDKISEKFNRFLNPSKGKDAVIIEEITIPPGSKNAPVASSTAPERPVVDKNSVISESERTKAIEELEKEADDIK